MPPLDWITGQVHVELAHEGRVRSFRFQGPFARIGEHERCEIRVPGIGAPVVAYVQVGEGYLAVLDLSETFPVARCEVQYVLPGGSVWLQPNARLTLESIQHDAPTSDAFSWESFELEDLRVLPNTLVLETGIAKAESKENLFRLTTVLSVLGTDPACQLQLKHRTIAKFQCVIFRGEHLGKPVRVVDLLAASPTLVDDKSANGSVLDVGGRLQCGKMILSARRVLTESLLPISVSTPPVIGTSPGSQGAPVVPGSTANPTKQCLNPATGKVDSLAPSESGPTQLPAPVGRNMALSPVENNASTSAPKTGTLIADVGQVLVPRLNPWEERLERNQEAMLASLQAISSRMESIEKSVTTANTDPRLAVAISELERAFGMVLEKINTLETGLQQVSDEVRREMGVLDQKSAAAIESLQENNASQLALLRATVHGLLENYSQAKSAADAVAGKVDRLVDVVERTSNRIADHDALGIETSLTGDGDRPRRGAESTSSKGGENTKKPKPGWVSDERELSANPAEVMRGGNVRPQKASSTQKYTGPTKPAILNNPPSNSPAQGQSQSDFMKGLIGKAGEITPSVLPNSSEVSSRTPNSLPPHGEESKSIKVGEALEVTSASNKHLDPDSPELLASSDSPEETLVLGSLMELRQRKASAKVVKVAILAGVFVAVVGIAVPIVWYQIPEGWRELIWRLGAKESVVAPERDSVAPKPETR